jgi:conjugation system TraG family ATPase
MDVKELRDFLPIMGIYDDCIISKRGDVTFGWRVYLPVAYSVNQAGYDSIIMSFMQAYRILPPYCIIHKQDIFRYDSYQAERRGEFLADCYENHFKGRRYLNGYCYLYLTFSSKSFLESNSSGSGFFHAFSNVPPSKEKIEAFAAVASQFQSILGNNSLLTLIPLKDGDYLHVGKHGEDCGILADYLRLYHKGIDYPLEFDKGYVACGDDILKCWFVEDSDSYPTMVNSTTFIGSLSTSASSVYLSGGSPIGYQLKIPHIVNRYVVTLPRKSVETELKQKQKFMNSFSLYSAGCRVNSEEIAGYLEQSAREGATTIKCFTDIMAWGKPDDIQDIRNKVLTSFTDLDITICEEMRIAPVLFYAGIPGAESHLGADCLMTSEMTAFLCHGLWDGYDSGMSGGCIKINDRRRMIPMRIDIQSVARSMGLADNQNIIVVGPSGSGKSFTMNKLVEDFYNTDQHCLIIDVGDSYEGLCHVINEETGGKDGIYNTYDPNHPFSFNPFKGRKEWNELDSDGERKSSGYEFIMSLLKTMYVPKGGAWSKEATAILSSLLTLFFSLWDSRSFGELEESLRNAFVNAKRQRDIHNGVVSEHAKYDRKSASLGWRSPLAEIFAEGCSSRDPIFDDFYQFVTRVVGPLIADGDFHIDNSLITESMFDCNNFGMALSKYAKGHEYGFLLNAEQDVDLFSSRMTVFEVDKIKDNVDMFPLWMLCIMHSFEDKMRSLSCQKVMVIEEAWSAIAKPSMASFIVWMWRTARKFRTSAVVVTQSLTDLTSNDIIKDAIVQNSSIKILLDQRKNANNFAESAKVLGLRPMDVGLVLSVNQELVPGYRYKEGFFSIGSSYSNVFGIEVSLEEALAFESEKSKKKPLQLLAKELGGSYIEAIKQVARDIREGKYALDDLADRYMKMK